MWIPHDPLIPISSRFPVIPFVQFKEAIRILRSQPGAQGYNHETDNTLRGHDDISLRALFDSIDADKSGTIEMDEYFVWTLDVAQSQGCGLETIFKKYDETGNGSLDASEVLSSGPDRPSAHTLGPVPSFLASACHPPRARRPPASQFALAVEDMGFSATFAHELFVELDANNSASITYTEVRRKGHVSPYLVHPNPTLGPWALDPGPYLPALSDASYLHSLSGAAVHAYIFSRTQLAQGIRARVGTMSSCKGKAPPSPPFLCQVLPTLCPRATAYCRL